MSVIQRREYTGEIHYHETTWRDYDYEAREARPYVMYDARKQGINSFNILSLGVLGVRIERVYDLTAPIASPHSASQFSFLHLF